MRSLLRPALAFVAIGLALYAALWTGAEALLMRQGHDHALFKIARLQEREVDWLVLGASHAMPLDFDGVNDGLQRASGRRIAQLAAPGAGPLYNRFIFERFGERHRARHLLYVVDAFAFHSRTWNEDRFVDAKLLRRTPWRAATAAALARYVCDEGVDFRALLDYTSGFSKLNSRERFERDVWEGAAQFERSARTSRSATAKRIAYLYPQGPDAIARARYLAVLASLLAQAKAQGTDIVVLKMPLPRDFKRAQREEAEFDAALAATTAAVGARFVDASDMIPDAASYFDTDHLNRRGLTAFIDTTLLPLLRGER
jgi:hypothetical protein